MSGTSIRIAQERKALMKLMDEGNFAVPSRRVDENIVIATWNIQQFNEKKSDRALQYISDICERFDLIALQEVKTDLRGLSKLQSLLPGNYKILITDPTGNSERFAFLYDKRTIIPTGLVCEIGFNVPADSHTGYQLHRMPYCVSFKAGRFDFVIVTVHIYYGSTLVEKKEREKEIATISEFIKKRERTEKNKVFDRDFFIMGDFNIETVGDQFFKALKGFKMPSNLDNLGTNYSRTRTFDKIAWVPRKSFKFSGKCNIVPYGKVLFQELEPKKRKKEISDHLPLWAEFQINKLTQELDQIINQ